MAANVIFLVFALVCFGFYFYGGFVTISSINSDKNDCKMTFMFEHPNYVRINFKENDNFPRYNLYAYAEGHLTVNARNMMFSGAPVLFIPGNSGSYKQSRSLASVALRKGIDNDWFHHLDYFTVDLNEEYSALFGGVLEEQAKFIEHAIRAILKLYERLKFPPKKLIVIGHSIGGKLVQKLLTSPDTANLINSVITLASPMDKPVLNWDLYINNFYQSIDNYWMENRQIIENSNNNSCGSNCRPSALTTIDDQKKLLDDKLLITIGGGSKDLLVHSGLTDSKFSDLHVMSTAMSKVWVESDHLCIVWCLQLVLVVNRFLYSIIAPVKYKGSNSKGLSFIEDKTTRLAKAEYHFLGMKSNFDSGKMKKLESPIQAEWFEDNRRIFTEKFKNGINKTRIQMIRLIDNILHRAVKIDVINQETKDWVFGCEAAEITGMSRYCSNAVSLSNYTVMIPSELPDRVSLSLNLHELKLKNPKWTHVLLKFAPTREPFQFTIDIHNPSDREIKIAMPKWYSFGKINVLDDTLLGASHYQLQISGLEETHQALELILTPKHCTKHQTMAKVCVPWTKGFDRYHSFSDDDKMIIWTPESRPLNYNTTQNSLTVDLLLDSDCRYSIAIRQSLGQMLSKIVQQFSHWLPAHLVAILCLSLKHQLTVTPKGEKFKCGSFHKALATCTPFFVITVSRLFFKFILMLKILPKPETLPTSLTVSIIIHGAALAMLIILTGLMWAGITFFGSIAHKLLFKIVHLPIPIISDAVVSIIEKFPISVAAVLVSLVHASCGGIALVVACIVYFILLSKMYEDYLENFVFKTAKFIAMKLFGRVRKPKNDQNEEKESDETEKTEPNEAKNKSDLKKDENEGETSQSLMKSDSQSDLLNDENEEVEKMLDEMMKKQREEKLKSEKENAASRVEYDSLTEGLDEINFHLPIFFLLVVITILSMPSVVTWAKNYHYARILTPDPMKISATAVLVSLGVIWQLNTPRDVLGYKYIGSFLYIIAVIAVLYCQDAIYRLNFIITGTFILIALHQLLSPKQKHITDELPSAADFFDKMKNNYDRFKLAKGFISR
ncbi:hypothetical protein PVAND_001627 [Polypedilum vanderplanki]|uniref:GPI inositol-deacylase n=1 Tax=Polypedilum vanderplanki TaxID=319348 RepID=A0A9J6BNY5_POLVA|nr:hypothetical protein PVAND_001627 [Polypedilum vanderplanki]